MVYHPHYCILCHQIKNNGWNNTIYDIDRASSESDESIDFFEKLIKKYTGLTFTICNYCMESDSSSSDDSYVFTLHKS